MLLTIRTTHQPATDLGFLLHKHPEHVHTREFPFGSATVFYPEASTDGLHGGGRARRRSGRNGAWPRRQGRRRGSVRQRPPVRRLVSALRCALALVQFRAGRSMRAQARTCAALELPLEARLAAVPCRGGEAFLRALFEPLGYDGRSDPPRARREHAGPRAEPAVHGHAPRDSVG